MASSTKKTLVVVVGSANPVKINATSACFVAAFPDLQVKCTGFSVDSGVSDQPWGSEETRTGAQNRAVAAAAAAAAEGVEGVDFAVGLEGGVESVDGGKDDGHEVYCCAWMCIKRISDGRYSFARTGSFGLPSKVAKLLRKGVELGDADDRVLRKDGSTNNKQKGGTVRRSHRD